MNRPTDTNALLTVRDLRTYVYAEEGVARAVDGVSFTVPRGKTLALVGESGCGKSMTSLSILGLLPQAARIAGGEILFKGRDLTKLSEREMRYIRGNDIAMVFQEPMTSLNPVLTVGAQITETVQLHRNVTAAEAREVAVDMLDKVGIPEPRRRVDAYPHELSGGMRQRVMIAMALCLRPELLIADEPTTALDVTIQAQILELMRSLQTEFGMSILFITHDLGVVAEMADEVAVMYASKIAELGTVEAIFHQPQHPYTVGLFQSIPRLGERKRQLDVIPGSVPNPLRFPPGCHFHPRCPFADTECRKKEPPLEPVELHNVGDHFAACWHSADVDSDGWRTRLSQRLAVRQDGIRG